MSLGGALQIGRSALIAHQAAIEVAGNNLANLATVGYHRQSIVLEPLRNNEIQAGIFVGRGVQIQSITRQVDAALEGRIRTNIADQSFSSTKRDIISQIEALQNEFSDVDVSTHLNSLFNGFSELANNPQDNALRTLVLREASNLSEFVVDLRTGLGQLQIQVDQSIDGAVATADDLLTKIQNVNEQVVKSGGTAPGLRDTRSGLLGQLAELLDISVIEQPSGAIDVFVGSTPLILNGTSRGVEVRRMTIDNEAQVDVVLKADGSVVNAQSGRIGAVLDARVEDVNFAIDELDGFINTLIFEINKQHSQGQGLFGFSSVTGANRVLDQTVALNDTESGTGFTPVHGSFQLHVTQKSTGLRQANTISVDLDGIDAANDTRLATLAADINAVANVSASVTADGRLKIEATAGDFEFSFSDDSSGVLAALGVNTFFAGSTAEDIAVNPLTDENPSFVAAGLEHQNGDNRNALALSQLRDSKLDSLNNLSINEAWARHVEDVAVRVSQASEQLEAESLVGNSLTSQQQAISGVNADEEVINLLSFQRGFQGSARFLQVVDELLETLMSLA